MCADQGGRRHGRRGVPKCCVLAASHRTVCVPRPTSTVPWAQVSEPIGVHRTTGTARPPIESARSRQNGRVERPTAKLPNTPRSHESKHSTRDRRAAGTSARPYLVRPARWRSESPYIASAGKAGIGARFRILGNAPTRGCDERRTSGAHVTIGENRHDHPKELVGLLPPTFDPVYVDGAVVPYRSEGTGSSSSGSTSRTRRSCPSHRAPSSTTTSASSGPDETGDRPGGPWMTPTPWPVPHLTGAATSYVFA
jgi:hypothetical protein